MKCISLQIRKLKAMIDSYDWARFIDSIERRRVISELLASCATRTRRSGENADSWEMIPLCKGQMEMTLGQLQTVAL